MFTSLTRAGSHEEKDQNLLAWWVLSSGQRNAVTETSVCIQEGPLSSVAQGIPCQGSLCLCRVSLDLQAH